MKIQVNTDNHVVGSAELTRHVESVVEPALERFADRITRVEVQLSDQNGHAKHHGSDKRCVLEARPASHQPVVVTHDAPTVELAFEGAAEKMERALDHLFDRLDNTKGRTSYAGEEEE